MHTLKTLTAALLFSSTTFALHAQSVKTQINFAQTPAGIATNSYTNKIYVAAPSYGGPTDEVTVINGATDTIAENITIPRGAQLPVVDLLRNRIFVVGCDSYAPSFICSVTVINGKTNKVIKTSTLFTTPGDGILGAAFDPICNKLYIANGSSFRIDIVDGSSLEVVGDLSTGGLEPFGISFNPVNHRLYVPFYSNQIQIFDTHTTALVGTAITGSQDIATAVNVATGNVFVADSVFGPSTTAALDKNGAVLAEIRVADTPSSLDVDPVTNKAFVVSTGTPALNVIDGKTNTVSATLQGVTANYVSVNYVSSKVYLSGNNGVIVVTEK